MRSRPETNSGKSSGLFAAQSPSVAGRSSGSRPEVAGGSLTASKARARAMAPRPGRAGASAVRRRSVCRLTRRAMAKIAVPAIGHTRTARFGHPRSGMSWRRYVRPRQLAEASQSGHSVRGRGCRRGCVAPSDIAPRTRRTGTPRRVIRGSMFWDGSNCSTAGRVRVLVSSDARTQARAGPGTEDAVVG